MQFVPLLHFKSYYRFNFLSNNETKPVTVIDIISKNQKNKGGIVIEYTSLHSQLW